MRERGRDFADIVYTMLVVEKQRSVEDVAATLGMTYASLHARLINRTSFSADEIRALVMAVPDRRLVAHLLDGTAFVAADRVETELHSENAPNRSLPIPIAIQHGATRVVVETTAILDTADVILSGAGLDHRTVALLAREIEAAEHALASLRIRVAATREAVGSGNSDEAAPSRTRC